MQNRIMKWACFGFVIASLIVLGVINVGDFDSQSADKDVVHAAMNELTDRNVSNNGLAEAFESDEDYPLPVQVDRDKLTKENHFGQTTDDKVVHENSVSINNEPGIAIKRAHTFVDALRNGNYSNKEYPLAEEKMASTIETYAHTIRGFGYAEDDITKAFKLLDKYKNSDNETVKEEIMEKLDAIFYKLDRKHNAWDNHNQTVLP
ncbi:hypothetical protein ERJ70_18330 [Sediminibacillus dalangtanensis]|uniref:Uncharacterized protein n=1 Tax=Sediminibacillus dalangtanensis TaxID=2729421 RepID=A0ABX7VVT2_9BACI|nr:hypothetical protein [Sediminibacillus dalangtanensis]QTN01075.1 hypothetical protein ERJ70_18330 [Sediminibacillus dalangtanensis]